MSTNQNAVSPKSATQHKVSRRSDRVRELLMPKVSERIRETQPPTVVLTRKYVASKKDALSLGQGIVYWTPPKEAIQAACDAATADPLISSYGPDEGLPQLREQLRHKIVQENGLQGVLRQMATLQAYV